MKYKVDNEVQNIRMLRKQKSFLCMTPSSCVAWVLSYAKYKNTNSNTITYSEYKKIHTLKSKRKKTGWESSSWREACSAEEAAQAEITTPRGSKIALVSFSFGVMRGIDLTFAECWIAFSKSRGVSIALKQATGEMENKWRAALAVKLSGGEAWWARRAREA